MSEQIKAVDAMDGHVWACSVCAFMNQKGKEADEHVKQTGHNVRIIEVSEIIEAASTLKAIAPSPSASASSRILDAHRRLGEDAIQWARADKRANEIGDALNRLESINAQDPQPTRTADIANMRQSYALACKRESELDDILHATARVLGKEQI